MGVIHADLHPVIYSLYIELNVLLNHILLWYYVGEYPC